jgi:protein-S-isoprenylcysteine O-methyltransferase Ste14
MVILLRAGMDFPFGIFVFITLFFLREDPKLIESRLKAGPGAEQQTGQKIIQALASIFFILPFLIASLDHRFGWSNIPPDIVILGDVLTALGLFFVFLVFRENTFTSATIELSEE